MLTRPVGQKLKAVSETVYFTFASPSPLTLVNLKAGDIIDEADVVITTAFDDIAATLEVGTVAIPGLVLPTNKINPTVLDRTFTSSVKHEIGLAEILRLTITPGTSTQGAGFVLFTIRR